MGGRARILSIEDDAAVRRLLSLALSERGHEVIEAADGEEGLRVAREISPDLIMLDIGLPTIHGSTVLDTLKKDPALLHIPVMVVSAWGEAVTETIARKHGAVDVIRKPFEVADLVARVDDVLSPEAPTPKP